MHILYFHQYFSTPAGAGATRSYETAKALIQQGHQVTVVCGSYSHYSTGLTNKPQRSIREGTIEGIKVIEICFPCSNYDNLFKRSITFLRFALKSIGIAGKIKYDLLFATSTPLTAGIPGIAMRILKPGKPFVFEVRDLWPELPREMGVIKNPLTLWAMSLLEWCSYRSAKACIGLSPGIVKGIKKRLGTRHKPVAMIPNGCDLELFKPMPNGETKWNPRGNKGNIEQRNNRSVSPGIDTAAPEHNSNFSDIRPTTGASEVFKAVFTGAHGIANGLDAVLDAAKVLKERQRPNIQFVFIGDGKLKPHLINRAKKEGLGNCMFLDPIPKLELADKMHQFDLGLMILSNVPAFYYGTSPNKFFDYIASGLPVLNNYPGWLAELIEEHQCGIAVPPENAEAFATGLEMLADNPNKRREMGVNARKLAEQHFARHKLSFNFCNFLEEQVSLVN